MSTDTAFTRHTLGSSSVPPIALSSLFVLTQPSPSEVVLLLSSFYRRGDGGTERSNDLPEVTQQVVQ